MRSDIMQAVGALARNPNDEKAFYMPGFNINNIYPIFQRYLNQNALDAFKNQMNGAVLHEAEEVITLGLGNFLKKLKFKSCKDHGSGYIRHHIYKARVCASRADKANTVKAVEKVLKTINALADKKYIKGVYMPLGVITVQMVNQPEPEYIVMSHFAMTPEGEQYAFINMPKMWVEDDNMGIGAMPERYEDQ